MAQAGGVCRGGGDIGVCGLWLGFMAAGARGVFGAGTGFRVGWRTGGALGFCRVSGAFIVAGGLGAGLSFYGV